MPDVSKFAYCFVYNMNYVCQKMMTLGKSITIILFIIAFSCNGLAQTVGLKSNFLYALTTTPNIGMETRIFKKSSIDFNAGFNPFRLPAPSGVTQSTNPKLFHWIIVPEYKYWFCRPYERWYAGVYADYGKYNLGGGKFLGIKDLERYRYEGSLVGGGVSVGYQWAFARRWGVEASLGVGYMLLDYRKYYAGACGALVKQAKRHYIGPSKASVSIIYYIY